MLAEMRARTFQQEKNALVLPGYRSSYVFMWFSCPFVLVWGADLKMDQARIPNAHWRGYEISVQGIILIALAFGNFL